MPRSKNKFRWLKYSKKRFNAHPGKQVLARYP